MVWGSIPHVGTFFLAGRGLSILLRKIRWFRVRVVELRVIQVYPAVSTTLCHSYLTRIVVAERVLKKHPQMHL